MGRPKHIIEHGMTIEKQTIAMGGSPQYETGQLAEMAIRRQRARRFSLYWKQLTENIPCHRH